MFIDELPNFVWLESLHRGERSFVSKYVVVVVAKFEMKKKKVLDVGQILRLCWPLEESDPGILDGSFVESNIRRTVSISFTQSITEK
jgi:hypothetical protein